MFKRIRKNKFTNFSILIEDLLSPFWDLGKVLLGESKILEIFAPEILKDSKEPQFRNCFKKSLVGLKIVIMMSWGFI